MAKRIMISGALGGPVLGYGGNTWAFLQYILGFRRLGFETYYVEHLSPNDCIDEDWQPVDLRVQDDYPMSLASYCLYDVLLVNPVIDGMNLVAK